MLNWRDVEIELERRHSEIKTAAAHRSHLDTLLGAEARLARKNRIRNFIGQKFVAWGTRLQVQTQELAQSSEFAATLITDSGLKNPESQTRPC